MSVIKKFAEWIGLKERLHKTFRRPPHFREGEVWWCCVGENVGSEINGKSNKFSRPVVIFKKLSVGTFLGIPTTSQSKQGTWYVGLNLKSDLTVAILSQIRVFDYKRLTDKIGQLEGAEYKRLKTGFRKLYSD